MPIITSDTATELTQRMSKRNIETALEPILVASRHSGSHADLNRLLGHFLTFPSDSVIIHFRDGFRTDYWALGTEEEVIALLKSQTNT